MDDEGFSADPSSSRGAPKTKEQLRRHYIRALHKVIDESDIVILVLDARDPEGCRSRLVEEEVRRRESEGKKLVFVLNKIGASPFFFTLSIPHRPRSSKKYCIYPLLFRTLVPLPPVVTPPMECIPDGLHVWLGAPRAQRNSSIHTAAAAETVGYVHPLPTTSLRAHG